MNARCDRGASVVEAAILFPFLVVLVMGITDLGRALGAQITLRDAVSEGALFGSQFPDDYALVRQRATDAGQSLNLALTDISIACPDPKTLIVSASHDVGMLTFVGQWFGSDLTINASSQAMVFSAGTCQPSP